MRGTLSLRSAAERADNCVDWDTDDGDSLALGAAVWEESASAGFVFLDGESMSFLSPALVRDGFAPGKIPKATLIVATSAPGVAA